jgi:TonB family protein
MKKILTPIFYILVLIVVAVSFFKLGSRSEHDRLYARLEISEAKLLFRKSDRFVHEASLAQAKCVNASLTEVKSMKELDPEIQSLLVASFSGLIADSGEHFASDDVISIGEPVYRFAIAGVNNECAKVVVEHGGSVHFIEIMLFGRIDRSWQYTGFGGVLSKLPVAMSDLNNRFTQPAVDEDLTPLKITSPNKDLINEAQIDSRTCDKPEYPATALRYGEQGTVTLLYVVDEQGQVIDSEVKKSSGFGDLDAEAKVALGMCRFKPVSIYGAKGRSIATVDYVWKLPE